MYPGIYPTLPVRSSPGIYPTRELHGYYPDTYPPNTGYSESTSISSPKTLFRHLANFQLQHALFSSSTYYDSTPHALILYLTYCVHTNPRSMNILPNLLKLFDYPQKERAPLSWHGLCTAISTTLMMMGVSLTSNGVPGTFALSELVARTWRINENTGRAWYLKNISYVS